MSAAHTAAAGEQTVQGLLADAATELDACGAVRYRDAAEMELGRQSIADAKERALELFPDKSDTFDLIYGSRFRRILAERYHLQ
mgnify:CR=1 FL=1